MLGKIKKYLFGSIFRRGATILTFLTLGSYVLGLVRDSIFARFFGASRLLDVYNAAFIIPDLLLNIFVAGALTAAFVPVFTHLLATGEEKEAENVATTMLAAAPVTILIIAIPAFIFMPAIASFVTPGFSGSDKSMLVAMSRLLLLSPIIFAVSNTIGNILISYERFVGYGLSPMLYNLGIIAGAFLVPVFGPIGLIIGTLGGAVLHLVVRLLAIVKTSFRARLPINAKDHNFLKILKLMIPRMAGQPIEQITFFIFTNMASALAVGSIAILSFARNFESVPVSLFGISFSTAIFSSLSRKAALKDTKGFIYQIKETGKALGLVSGLSMLFYLLFSGLVVRIFFGGGHFSEADIIRTSSLLAFFAFSIPAESFIHLFVRAFYAIKDTWTPILISIPGLGLIVILAKLLVPAFSINALAISYAIANTIEAIILFLILRRKLRHL